MKLIRYQGELSVSGTNVLMKLCLEKQRKIERVIERTEDRRTLKLLSRAWWAEFFKIEDLCGGMTGKSTQQADADNLEPERSSGLLLDANIHGRYPIRPTQSNNTL